MGFIDTYKRLDKLCSDILDDERGITAYIEEMKNTSNGSFYVKGWDDNLKQLKHYRWIRNQIAHEPGYTEQNMCEPNDTKWLEDFYNQLLNQTDPLTQYSKAMMRRTQSSPTQTRSNQTNRTNPPMQEYNPQTYEDKSSSVYVTVGVLIACSIVAVCFIILMIKYL